jgi:hypothetical protein
MGLEDLGTTVDFEDMVFMAMAVGGVETTKNPPRRVGGRRRLSVQ